VTCLAQTLSFRRFGSIRTGRSRSVATPLLPDDRAALLDRHRHHHGQLAGFVQPSTVYANPQADRTTRTMKQRVAPSDSRDPAINVFFGRVTSLGIGLLHTEGGLVVGRQRAVVRRTVEMFDTLDAGALEAVLSPELLLAGAIMNHLPFSAHHIKVTDLVSEGDRVAIRVETLAVHSGKWEGVPPTGKRWTNRGTAFARLDAGKIVEFEFLFDELAISSSLAQPSRRLPEVIRRGLNVLRGGPLRSGRALRKRKVLCSPSEHLGRRGRCLVGPEKRPLGDQDMRCVSPKPHPPMLHGE